MNFDPKETGNDPLPTTYEMVQRFMATRTNEQRIVDAVEGLLKVAQRIEAFLIPPTPAESTAIIEHNKSLIEVAPKAVAKRRAK